MRRYLQGTLDYCCAIYAVINALALTHDISLAKARDIMAQSLHDFSCHQRLWRAFLCNQTDHYWVVRHLLAVYCMKRPMQLSAVQPFASCLLPAESDKYLENAVLHLPEKNPHPSKRSDEDAPRVWAALQNWLSPDALKTRRRAAIFRFHRFLPDVEEPIISHWTTGARLMGEVLFLHDASSEKNAILNIEFDSLRKTNDYSPLLYIAPESVLLLQSV